MNNLPPVFIRRLVIAPLVLALTLLLLALSPVILFVSFIADVFLPGSWRTLRLAAFATGYLLLELVGFVAMFVLWIASGFGIAIRSAAMQTGHFAFMRWWLTRVNNMSRRLFRLKVVIEDRPVPRPGPVLVFSRHAGPGNSMLLIGTILIGYKRRPRIVMLAKVQWEPLYDIMLNRLPNRFIKHDPSRRDVYLSAIGELASNLGDRDAFVLFPEGKDFTPRVRLRAIDYLKQKGYLKSAERAERMKHVLPPRHNGVMSALKSAPDADVVLVAHSVLEDIGTFKQLWKNVPLRHPVVARYWRIPASEVPLQTDELIEWLYGWWERIDEWIDRRESAAAG